MKEASIRLLIALTLVLFAGCSTPSSDVGSVQFTAAVRQDLASGISRVAVTSSAADFPSVTTDLVLSSGTWGGYIGNIPAGSNRTFLAQAFDASGAKLFEGSASGITIYAGRSTSVAIALQQVDAPPPFENEAPLIDSLVASSSSVLAGGSLSFVANAHDPNMGDTLSYAWSSTAGTFSSTSTASTSWTAPHSTGIQTVTLTVKDPGGLSTSISLVVNVTQAGGEGSAWMYITFNNSPRVTSIRATPGQLVVGQATAVSVTAADPDGNGLSYSWGASCSGSWSNASSNSAQFTPSVLPDGACNNCRLTVTISDGRGGQSTGSMAMCVSGTAPTNHLNPVIIRSYRSSSQARAGQVLTFEVVASDPENSALTFSWAANSGSLGTPSHGTTSSRVTWSASCVSGATVPTITATVSNAFKQTATRSFVVAGLPACPTANWALTGSMAEFRYRHTATLLPNGKVLVAGYSPRAAELYDPSTGRWSATGSMAAQHNDLATATLLNNGKVLIAGGINSSGWTAPAELYDSVSNAWSTTGSMVTPRKYHTATLLKNGKVLVAGGQSSSGYISTAEVYDPTSGTWSPTGSMSVIRIFHAATLLSNGKVLVTGGFNNTTYMPTAELYDPDSGTWSATSPMSFPRSGHTATRLLDGKVLIAGGHTSSTAAEIYDPASGSWTVVGSMALARYGSQATLLLNGKVLITGGYAWFAPDDIRITFASAEVYDPASGSWSDGGTMNFPRDEHTATLLPNGKVLVAAGWDNLTTTELYTP
ncbi:Kelch repeat-containing protein [Archangium lipolyticum]|uniref:Kelch repeat-containing protein n=1 Tax=Archangium lipolyticum TaxID=2970465 RepID=UPI00214A28DF|nr:kelch repeat-containing protein [Archangium lipolyticum]